MDAALINNNPIRIYSKPEIPAAMAVYANAAYTAF